MGREGSRWRSLAAAGRQTVSADEARRWRSGNRRLSVPATGGPRSLAGFLVVVLAISACGSGGSDVVADDPSSDQTVAAEPANPDDSSVEDDADEAEADTARPPRPRGSIADTYGDDATVADHGAALRTLRSGGQVVFIRHGATEHVSEDAEVDLDDVATQRNLSEEGRQQAAAIGEAFEELEIPVGEVIASPYWRARETAEIAFGADAVSIDHDLLYDEHPDAHRPHLAEALRSLLAQAPEGTVNTVIVGHGANLEGAARVMIDAGAAAVFTPTSGGGADLIDVIPADAWPDVGATRRTTTEGG